MRSEIYDNKLLKNHKLSIDSNDLKKAKNLLYYSYAYAPIEFNKKLNRWHIEWAKTGGKGVSPPIGLKPSVRLHILKEALAEEYGLEYVRFLITPYFMKIKIIEITSSTYTIDTRGMKTTKIDLKVKILDVLKGSEFYSIGDIINISYLPIWFSEKSSSPEFKVDQIYMLPLRHWSEKGNTGNFNQNKDLLLSLNGGNTLYKIENGIVQSPLFPEKNLSKTWKQFKNEFVQKYLIEKPGE